MIARQGATETMLRVQDSFEKESNMRQATTRSVVETIAEPFDFKDTLEGLKHVIPQTGIIGSFTVARSLREMKDSGLIIANSETRNDPFGLRSIGNIIQMFSKTTYTRAA